MIRKAFIALLIPYLHVTFCTTLHNYLNENDIKAFRDVFLSSKSEDNLSSLYYSSVGLKLIGDKVADITKICEAAKKLINDQDIESLYYAAGLAEVAGGSCKFSLPKSHDTVSAILLNTKSTPQDLYRAMFAAKKLQIKMDTAKQLKALQDAMAKDDSASSLNYIFNAAVFLDEVPNVSVDVFFNKIEDCVAQADEFDKKYLQYEGGLTSTSMTVYGIYALAQRAKKSPVVKPAEAVKFANFLISRKGVKLARPAYYLLQTLQMLTTNQFQIPIVFSKVGSLFDISTKNPAVKVRIVDLMGKPIDSLSLIAESAIHTASKTTLLTKKQFKFDATNKVYELNLIDSQPKTGFYQLTVSATSTSGDKRLVGNEAVQLSAKVAAEITVENVQLAVVDREQSGSGTNLQKLASFTKLSTQLEADVHQKMVIKFNVKDKMANAFMKVHQAFVVFTYVEKAPTREIIFIAESDANKVYSFDVDFLKAAKDFENESGKYTVKLIIGDSVVNNPIDWHMADIRISFPAQEKTQPSTVEHITYERKPEIIHMFRPAERRPPEVVSDTFTILAVLPLFILFLIWLRIGVNISNFKFNFYTIGFHLGLAGIFVLYFLFWLQFNMFQTLKYLTAIGCFTFLTGNRMLKAMADRRKSKTE